MRTYNDYTCHIAMPPDPESCAIDECDGECDRCVLDGFTVITEYDCIHDKYVTVPLCNMISIEQVQWLVEHGDGHIPNYK